LVPTVKVTTPVQSSPITKPAISPSARTRATTPVPAPGGGNVNQTVPVVPVTTKAPVSLSVAASYGTGVTARMVKIDNIKTVAQLPGEIAGPGVALTVEITNSSTRVVELNSVVVDLIDVRGVPAIPMTAAPASPFAGSVAPGKSATGVYVFTLGSTYRDPGNISVSYSIGAPIVLFAGNVK